MNSSLIVSPVFSAICIFPMARPPGDHRLISGAGDIYPPRGYSLGDNVITRYTGIENANHIMIHATTVN